MKTENGKEVVTYIDPKTAHVRVKFTQGGELPACLDGLFTSVRMANQAILSYVEAGKKVKGK